MIIHVNANMPFQNIFFYKYFDGNFDGFNKYFDGNATFLESKNTGECNDVYESVCSIPNMYQNQHPYDNPLQCKCFAKIMVGKFIKASIFNENKHTGLNKRKNKRFWL